MALSIIVMERLTEIGRGIVLFFDDKIEHIVAYVAGAETLYHTHHIVIDKAVERRRKKRLEKLADQEEDQANV